MRLRKTLFALVFTVSAAIFVFGDCVSVKAVEKKYTLPKLNQMIKKDPNNYDLYNKRAEYYYNQKQYNQALRDINKMIKIRPDYVVPYYTRGLCYFYLKKYSLTLKSSDECIKMNSNFFGGYFLKGMYYSRFKKDYHNSAKQLKKANELYPSNPFILNNLGYAYEKKGEIGKAIKSLEECIELNKNYIPAYNNLCWIYATSSIINKGDEKKALIYAEKIINSSNPKENWYDTIAAAYARNGKFEESITYQNMALNMTNQKENPDLYKGMQDRLKLYKNNKPYIED